MPETFANMLLSRSLRGLRDLWRDLVPASWRDPLGDLRPDLPEADLPLIRQQMSACLEARGGEVSARARAAGLGRAYLRLNATGRERFLRVLADEFQVDQQALDRAILAYQQSDEAGRWDARDRLRETLTAPRVRLLTQFNELPEGTKFAVDLRADLLKLEDRDPALHALDRDLSRLLASWFDVGFLGLERITWHSPASLLEKLIDYEAVQEIESWNDLRNRLDTDRRCYAFFHPRMPGEPLIFVEVALVRGLSGSIQSLLDLSPPALDPQSADTAIFYSISNTQKGLRGISFGGFLIKRVVDDLQRDLPRLKQFATLSPIPGFRPWLNPLLDECGEHLLTAREFDQLSDALTKHRSTRGRVGTVGARHKATRAPEGDVGPGLAGRLLAEALAEPRWASEAPLAAAMEGPLLRLCARYLLEEKRGGRPRDPVARFHLGNGARIERIDWLGDVSVKGLGQSAGLMVNYSYRLADIEKNHEAYVGTGRIAATPQVRKLLREGAK